MGSAIVPTDPTFPTREQIAESLRNEYPWTQFISDAEFKELVDKIHDAERRDRAN
jgi:hypothetical protein